MRLEGTYTIAAPRAKVWELLMDPKAIASCVPGCEGFEPLGGDEYSVRLTAGDRCHQWHLRRHGGTENQVAPESYRLVMEGSGGPGFVNGDAKIALSESGTSTTVEVTADVEVGGTIARVGQRLLGSVSKMMLDRFFACMSGKV